MCSRINRSFVLPFLALFLLFPLPAFATDIVVDTFEDNFDDDNEDCSLREAVAAANSNIAIDTCPAGQSDDVATDNIILAAGTYTLTRLCGEEFDEFNAEFDGTSCGDLDIYEDVVVNGAGIDATTITWDVVSDTNGDSEYEFARHFDILGYDEVQGGDIPDCSDGCAAGLQVVISNLTLENGEDGTGGAVHFGGSAYGECEFTSLTLTNVRARQNFAHYQGGAVGGYGQLIVNNSEITQNQAGLDYYYGYGDGGGIWLVGPESACGQQFDSSITDSSITENTASMGSGGGLFNAYWSNLNVTNTTIDNNRAQYAGGGVFNMDSNLNVLDGTISNNKGVRGDFFPMDEDEEEAGVYEGGGLFNSIRGYFDFDSEDGPDHYPPTATTVTGTTIANNLAVFEGGGVANSGGLRRAASQEGFSGQIGLSESTMTLDGVTVSENTLDDRFTPLYFEKRYGGRGAGVSNGEFASVLRILNSTIKDNTGGFVGGGLFNGWVAEVSDSTISNNSTFELFWYDQEFLNNEVQVVSIGGGGGIASQGSTIARNVTISGNMTGGIGGGVANNISEQYHYAWLDSNDEDDDSSDDDSSDEDDEVIPLPLPGVDLRNVTVTENSVEQPTVVSPGDFNPEIYGHLKFANNGGGIATLKGEVRVRNSLVTGNTDESDNFMDDFGTPSAAPTPGDDPEVADNAPDCWLQPRPEHDDCQLGGQEICNDLDPKITSEGYNLIGDNTACDGDVSDFATAENDNFDKIGTGEMPLDPGLGPLADNGGPTFTHALTVGGLILEKLRITTSTTMGTGTLMIFTG